MELDGELSELEFSEDDEGVDQIEEIPTILSEMNIRNCENPVIEKLVAEEMDPIQISEADTTNTTQYHWRTRPFQTPGNIEWKSSLPDPPSEILTPISYFKMFFDDNMINSLVYHTNLYAMQTSDTILGVSKKEMEQFIGINMLTGIVKIPSVYGY